MYALTFQHYFPCFDVKSNLLTTGKQVCMQQNKYENASSAVFITSFWLLLYWEAVTEGLMMTTNL